MNKNELSKLKNFLKDQKIDFFLLPNSDQFFSEYLPESEKRIQYLTGFSGSNATIIFGQEKSQFFTDGRYTLQAANEIDYEEFNIFNIANKSALTWLEAELKQEQKLALDPKLISINFFNACKKIVEKKSAKLVLLEENPVNKIWPKRPLASDSKIFALAENIAGLNSKTKRAQILQKLEADAQIITKPENLCWLLNLRAADIEFTPLMLAYGILFKDEALDLFLDEERFSKLGTDDLHNVTIIAENNFSKRLADLRKSINKIQIDASTTNYWLYQLLQKNNFEIIFKEDAIELAKSCKNKVEINGAIAAHKADGLAVTKFLFWLENSLKNNAEIDEISAAEKLLDLRKAHPDFLYPSFASISGFASNGAIIHYRASEKTNKKLKGNSLYLIDSGGQYFGKFCGTTDITRTVAIGLPAAEMIENFTRVLKGHITLARAKFPRDTSGAQLDVLARFHLWQAKKDYDHGTGHGVGSLLSVHEGPCGISKRAHQALLEGMILSNEPGFYENGKYGIRIENLMLVEQLDEKFLQFNTLTLAPLDAALIDFKMMTYPEKKWLKEYHERIFAEFGDKLEIEEKNWLQDLVKKYQN